ncbi:MAG: 23S rRNA (adenine(2503)-C(2))-methyltransferase RlmN [Deltaproteobacteria bacterium]|nr:23S rRNA (adenine(2503)-C(2))-methyltransferase RlmN [Deltaproteobacteria bacterium]MBW2171326.1 23S rRNA (adenine(2503)-C(2))-methyltransferase RlmN [Deltaproteobacteria bacterium]MBW2259304.1 23S rRNA (adenine(2503)-C(2))-methyltransferase RlmN [Deltaproteobacteria bacterium]
MMSDQQDVKGFSEESLIHWLEQHGIPSYRAGQILRWIYHKGVYSFSEMTDLSKDLRGFLSEWLVISRLEVEQVQTSEDGSRKYLFRLQDGQHIESVLIPEPGHWTLCISTQVGCGMGCAFCLTGRGGFVRNLEPQEIIGQVCTVRDDLPGEIPLTNVVLMGMGEPFANYQNVVQAIRTILGNNGLQFSSRRVTLSTAGLPPGIDDLGRDVMVNLAVSLNAADNDTRSRLMPINRTYPLETLLSACRRFPLPPRRTIMFEYVLIAGVNDAPEDAERLARLLRPLRAKINLIPFNPFEGTEFERPDEGVISAFQKVLMSRHYTVVIRHSKGADICAACGQLSPRSRNAKASPVPDSGCSTLDGGAQSPGLIKGA